MKYVLQGAATPHVFTFAVLFATTILSSAYACTYMVLATPANYAGLCGCASSQLPIRQNYGTPCGFAYGCFNAGDNFTISDCPNPVDMTAWPWLFYNGWVDSTYLVCLDCPTTTTSAAATLLSTTTSAAATLSRTTASALSATTSAAFIGTTTSAAAALSTTAAAQALTTSTASEITSTYAQATSLGATTQMVAATTSTSTTAPSQSLSPMPVHIDGFISVAGPWTATAITIFSAVNTTTSGLARLTVDGPVTIQHGARATIELSEDINEPKRVRLILATSISGEFDRISIQPKKSGCNLTKYRIKSVTLPTLLAVDVSSEVERSCATNRAWLIGVIIFASLFGVAVIIAFISVFMERWKPEWAYLSRKRADSSSYYDANSY